MLRIGIDIGGTFTDFVVLDTKNGRITTFKILSNSIDPASTVLQGLQRLTSSQPLEIIHGSTVATNALLERKGAHTALITTLGFKDVLQIARQNRPNLYDWNEKPAPPLVPSSLRFEVDERIDYQGNVLKSLELDQIDKIISFLGQKDVESVAVCLLFSFLYPNHEEALVEQLRKAGYFVSASSEILPEFREYERTSTTVVNAYVSPILDRYLSKLEASLPNTSLQIMQSNGGMISVKEAGHNGARCILSGPAGGIVGAQNIVQTIIKGKSENEDARPIKLITFDMGGTSTDVSLIDGQPGFTTEACVGGCPIHLPMLDIHTIGAGGGSIAYVDPGGALRVGPESAGAFPGPACYGQGELPTVTDANLVLGRLIPDYFLGGRMQIEYDRGLAALSKLGKSLNMTAIQAAMGVIKVVDIQMEHALRVISVERGHDPQDFSLFAFGGAGGLHAVDLARNMGIPRVIISKFASTLSAYGMLASDVIKDYVKTVMFPGNVGYQVLADQFSTMMARGKQDINKEGIQVSDVSVLPSLDVRYVGQSYELNVPFSEHFIEEFHSVHRINYGYAYEDRPIEVVNLRVSAIGKCEPITLPRAKPGKNQITPIPIMYRKVELSARSSEIPVYEYEKLSPGCNISGPALIVSADTTILIYQHDTLSVDAYQNLIIDVSQKYSSTSGRP